jgi:hypothetical protein
MEWVELAANLKELVGAEAVEYGDQVQGSLDWGTKT